MTCQAVSSALWFEQMTAHVRTKAIVLRRTDYGEADRILTVITPQGQISMLAKGARRQRSKLAGGVELLSENDLAYIERRGSLKTLISSRSLQTWHRILADYGRLQLCYDLLKLSLNLSEHQGGEHYLPLRDSLQAIDDPANNPVVVETWYYLTSLKLTGHQPELNKDESGDTLQETKHYHLDAQQGRLSEAATGLSSDHIKLWRLSLTNPLDVVLRIGGAAKAAEEAIDELRRFVQYTFEK